VHQAAIHRLESGSLNLLTQWMYSQLVLLPPFAQIRVRLSAVHPEIGRSLSPRPLTKAAVG